RRREDIRWSAERGCDWRPGYLSPFRDEEDTLQRAGILWISHVLTLLGLVKYSVTYSQWMQIRKHFDYQGGPWGVWTYIED
ncbi:hypothetical protein KI387_042591, partial [Taxus chinensis]